MTGTDWRRSGDRRSSWRNGGGFGGHWTGRHRSGGGVDAGYELLGHDGGAIGGDDLDQHTRRGRGDFEHHFVSFDVDQYFVDSNSVADFFLPLQQSGFSH